MLAAIPQLTLRRFNLQVLEKHQEPVWPTDAVPPTREPLEDFQEHHIGLQGSGLVAAREAAAQIEVMLASAGQQACIVRHTAASLHVWRATRFDQHAALMLFGAGCCMLVAGF